jgi:hypothetical protein
LELSFARTLHKFQGQSVGPSHYHKYMVFGPGTATFEANNPGLLYVGLSRVETLGLNVEQGHFYFTGFDATVNRLTNVTHKRGTNGKPTKEKYKALVCRERWLHYLQSHERFKLEYIGDEEKFHLRQWLQQSFFSKVELDRIMIYHNRHRCH